MIEESVPSDNTKPEKPKILLYTMFAFLAALVLCFFLFAMPAIRYSNGVKSAEKEDYAAALRSFEKAGDYKDADRQAGIARRAYAFQQGNDSFESGDYTTAVDFFDQAGVHPGASQMLRKARNGVLYSEGMTLIKEAKYKEAIDKLKLSNGFSDAKDQILNSYRLLGEQEYISGDYVQAASDFTASGDLSRVSDCVEALIDKQLYADAASIQSDIPGDAFSYARARVAMAEGDYEVALAELENSGTYRDAAELIPSVWYSYGQSLLENEQPGAALDCFNHAGGFSDSTEMISVCRFFQAEKYFREGYLNSAKAGYETLPEDYVYQKIAVADRLAVLEKNKKVVEMCGKWRASGKNTIETRETYSSGYWYSWTNTYTAPFQYITVTCTIEDNGEIRFSGNAEFYRYTNYSSNSNNLNVENKTISFKKTIKSQPSWLDIGNSSHLTFTGKVFQLVYKYVDQSKNYADYTYTSNYTYGTLVQAY